MNTAPTYGLSSGTPQWALDPYRFPGLEGLDEPEAPAGSGDRPAPEPAGGPRPSSRRP
ncbi:hypothetical protein [Streptomyces sp. NBC_00091]|uniref:hypothetical protein n=1 Tax=Streptomyces sp. NBC_00091 TaxID=2975648 RepID=UPI00225B8B57|nr:hypothetical protein [Streptomyces sp. NBC_00091]MCX5380541.1 hypothetical protein [Streptomyces sp. NBC_00091]